MKIRENKYAVIHDDQIDLKILECDSEYQISFNRMDTPEKVLGWILQLVEKNWITKEHIETLIHCSEDHGVKVQWP